MIYWIKRKIQAHKVFLEV